MLRFFESEVDSWWSTAAGPFPPPPPHHCVAEPVHPGLQWIGNPYGQSGMSPPMIMAPACRRVVPSVLTTVDFVNRRWLPNTEASKVSSLSSPNSSSSVDSMNSYGGCGSISWQSDNAFSIEPSLDPFPAPFKVEISSSGAMDGGRKNQHEAMVDMGQRRRKLDEKKNKFVSRDSKRQKTGVQEEKFHCFTSFESTSSSPSKMMTAQQTMKAPVKKSQKLGDKITALQQLVSPFGKADTASVLHEAALYIKALHEQVKLLSKPYFDLMSSPDRIQGIKNSCDNYHHKSSRLRGEGLRVVPIPPSIISLANQEVFDGYMTRVYFKNSKTIENDL